MNQSDSVLVAVLVLLIVGLVIIIGRCKIKSSFTFNNSDYQYSNANVKREYDYYKCISQECGGNTHDYNCLEKCHLKAYRKGMLEPDIKDMVCAPYVKDENAYYRCLDDAYADYKYP